MADYRLSANIISRGKGQSSVASAAYRSASRLVDERTGEVHDYTRKQGVIHTEVMTPKGTPEWMHDRAQLWNAIEAVERRKDAQLSREIQLSLPHELSPEQRLELVRDFVREQFVNHGMIADVAIHVPSREGDDRNHHAHVMLSMRELTGDGFGKKNRDWNSPDTLANWREQWAHHQNRELKRHGHEARVDHRSYEAQGIDREPTQHLGPVANDMELQGKDSRIGNENREIEKRNSDRARNQIELARVSAEKARFEGWAQERFSELEAAQDLTRVDLDRRHHQQRQRLEARMRDQFGQAKATIKAELQSIDRRLEAKGVRKVLRDVLGRTRTDQTARQEFAASLKDIQQREDEQRQALVARQGQEVTQLKKRMQARHEQLARGVEKARDRRENDGWARNVVKRPPPEKKPAPKQERPAPKAQPQPQASRSPQKPLQAAKPPEQAFIPEFLSRPSQSAPKPPAEPSDRLGLDDKKRTNDSQLNERDQLKMPWERTTASKGKEPPWKRARGDDRKRSFLDKTRGGKSRDPER